MAQSAQESTNLVKVLVIGLDAATFDFIIPWVKDGSLPCLSKIMNEGVHGPLVSTIPSVTPPAWTSMFTGTNPGKHGIFHFHDVYAMPERSIVINATYRQSPVIWEILTEVGKNSVLLNVPMTYPPEPINGVIISGFLTPRAAEDFFYPPSLQSQIVEMNYQIGQIFGDESHLSYKQIEKNIRNRTDMAKWLMQNHQWDFFTVVYMASDGVVHRYPHNPDAIKYVYQRLDNAIAELIDTAPSNTIVMITSDHGIGLVPKQFMINNWLNSEGLLKFKRKKQSTSRSLTTDLLKSVGQFGPLRRLLHQLPLGIRKRFLKTTVPQLASIDSTRSLAWGVAATRNYALVGLNTKQNEKEAFETLCAHLYSIRDPKTNQQVVSKVHRSTDLLSGPALKSAPQVIVETHKDYQIKCGFTYDRTAIRNFPKPLAAHERNGVFLATGSGIQSENPANFKPNIWDVMPTILHILNVPPPPGLDGQVLTQIFTSGSEYALRKQLAPTQYSIQKRKKKTLTDQEQQEVVDRLRQLGYL
jgi:predicted AlkP superfamily phosphohydrolase/phosphomutase